MRRFVHLVAAIAVLAGSSVIMPASALAECDGPIPDFRYVVPTAKRVFIGDVTSVDNPDASGFGSRFTVRVGYVLKGRVHLWPIRISNVHGSPCAPVITASKGQRIALALDGKRPRPYPTNSIAYISGNAPADWVGSDPYIRADEVYRLAGVPLDTRGYATPNTATAAVLKGRSGSTPSALLVVFSLALVASLRAWPSRDGGRGRRLSQ